MNNTTVWHSDIELNTKGSLIITRAFLQLAQWAKDSHLQETPTAEQRHHPINQPSTRAAPTWPLRKSSKREKRWKGRLANQVLLENVLQSRHFQTPSSIKENVRRGSQRTHPLDSKWAIPCSQTSVTAENQKWPEECGPPRVMPAPSTLHLRDSCHLEHQPAAAVFLTQLPCTTFNVCSVKGSSGKMNRIFGDHSSAPAH